MDKAVVESSLGAEKREVYQASSSQQKLPRQEVSILSTSSCDNPGITKKGMLLASAELVWLTLHSYWYDKDKKLHLEFCHLPFGLPS